jgi:phosphatidylserine/phosphatidylglycerophosphate/cardiolipin synthase-like enzyme
MHLALSGLCVILSVGVMAAPSTAVGTLTSRAYFNNPYETGDASNVTRNLIVSRINGSPSGSKIRAVTYNISDTAIEDALEAAYRRGVAVRIIMANANCDESPAVRLRSLLGSNPGADSFLVCSVGSARSAGGVVHQKSFTFSETTGNTPYVTLVGSANLTIEGYADQWVDMYQYADRKDVFDAYNEVFALQKDQPDMASPYRRYALSPGRADFFPVDDEAPTSADDPVLAEIKAIPNRSDTTIWVANYAMHGDRGNWLADALVAKHRAGANVKVLTGMPSGPGAENTMINAGVSVVHAFDNGCPSDTQASNCNYIHLKLMTAKYWADGQWNYRVWTGSDNWSDDSLNQDEVVQRVSGVTVYDDYVAFLKEIRQFYN